MLIYKYWTFYICYTDSNQIAKTMLDFITSRKNMGTPVLRFYMALNRLIVIYFDGSSHIIYI